MKLTNDIATQWWMDSLERPLKEEQQQALDQYLEANPALAEELKRQSVIWKSMGDLKIPEPSTEMDLRFDALLGEAVAASRKPSFADQVQTWFVSNWQVSVGSLALGLVIGIFLFPKQQSDVSELTAEVQNMKQLLMLTMIEKPQAQDRIKAVNLTRELPKIDSKVTDALISTLNQDQSINVRLAALEALIPYGQLSEVRLALIKSIKQQDSPLLQVALADAMILLQEKAAVDSFEEILQSEEVDDSIKPKLQSTIETLRSI